MVLVKNCQFFMFFFSQQQARRMFYDILERKNAFLEYKKLKLKKAKKFARKGRREEENGRLIFIHPIVPCTCYQLIACHLCFEFPSVGTKKRLRKTLVTLSHFMTITGFILRQTKNLLLYKIHYSQEIKIIYYSFLQEPSSKSGVAES